MSVQFMKKATALVCAVSIFTASVQPALALPEGGNVVGGSATITSGAGRTDIHQTSSRAVINWDSFNVASPEHVNFNQPDSSSVALNRVVGGGGSSKIYGALTANGNVIIVNPQGVLFGQGAQVNVGGLVATSIDTDNESFMQGKANFNKAGSANATIQNDGNISVKEAGIAAFVAPNVVNNGVIEAKLGKVQLGSGDSFSVDLYGDGLINLQASKDLNEQLVKNSGTISADGGSVLLTAAAAENAVSSVINMDGIIQANSVGNKNGKVQLIGQKNKAGESTVLVSGKIDAKGASGQKGGKVEVLGNKVALLDGAKINASGGAGGGTVLVGGEYLGGGNVQTASHTVIQEGAKIDASATENGEGGRVIVWSDEYTAFSGVIDVLGGLLGGNGGFVETSSKDNLQADGVVNARAVNGTAGQWLLDPRNVTISNSNTTGGSLTGAGLFSPTSNNANIRISSILSSLNAGTSVTINTGSGGTQAGTITVQDNIIKNSGSSFSPTLTLNAAGDIITNSNVTIGATSGSLNVAFISGGAITFGNGSDIQSNGGNVSLNSTGATTLNNNATIITKGGSVTINGGSISLANSADILTDGGNVTFTSAGTTTFGNNSDIATKGGDVNINSAGTITLNNSAKINSEGGDILLRSTGGAIALTGNNAEISSNKQSSNNDGKITLVGTAFTSSAGSDALDAGSNRFLIYTVKPENNTLDGLTSDFFRYSCTYGGSCPTFPASGNGFLYSNTPLLTLTINPNPVSVTYGSATPTFTYTLSGYQGADGTNDVVTGNASFTTNYTQGSDVGNYNITSAAGTLSSSLGYGFIGTTLVDGLTVIARNLTVSLQGVVSKVYDGTNTATLNSGNYNISNVYGTDVITITNTAGAYGDKNVGTNKQVTVNNLAISGAKAGNYNLVTTTVSGNVGSITPRVLTVTATGGDKTYDGSRDTTVTLLDNRVAGDNLTTSYATARFDDKNAGNGRTVTVGGIGLAGTDANNYTFNTSTTTVANIAKRVLTVVATGVDKTYDGTKDATVTLSDNRVAGDNLTRSYTTAQFDVKDAGTARNVNVSGINIAGTDANNYTFNTTATTTANIAKRALAITASGGSKTYDGTRDTTVTLSDNRVSGDNLTTSYSTARFANENAGNNKTVTVSGISLSGTDANNYTYNNSTTVLANIAKRVLTIIATGVDKTYDGSRNANVILSDNRVAGDNLNTSYSNARFADKNAGTGKTVNVNGISLSGSDANNYTYNTTAVTTANIAQRVLTISALALDKTYDGTVDADAILYDNRVWGDRLNTDYALAEFNNKNAGSNKTVTVSGITLTGADAQNYTFNTSTTDTATIFKRLLNITATGNNKVYDGTTDATVTLSDNHIAGDDIATSYDSAFYLTKNVGNNKLVTVVGLDVAGTDAGNYTYLPLTLTTANITPRALTISATGIDKIYDGLTNANVTLSDNRVAGDKLNTGYGSANFATRDAGNNIVVTVNGITLGGADAGNYTFNTTASTTANIAQRVLNVSADSFTKTYGDVDPSLTYTHDALQAGDDSSIFTGGLTRVAGENVVGSPYAIEQGKLSAGNNYIINFTGGTLNINPANLYVTADNQIMVMGNGVPPLTYQVSGYKFLDDASIFTGGLSTVPPTSLPGYYLIQQGTLAANSNYVMNFTNGNLLVVSPTSQINSSNQQSLFSPEVVVPGGSLGTLLSLVLSRNPGLNLNSPAALASLEPASGGEGTEGANNLQNLEPGAGDEIIPLMDCNKTFFDSRPCQI